ncbi:hypothetical protein H112_05946 [Trichophyton rubrum D6]|uniref:N-acetylglucosamine-induced protein 1 n=4 Tax=Trichophyton TaxID=5550 RepID=A0A178EQT0_TRIRU|nr:uncharacterized protein TERG_03653 [Trichophyton rubrum CBS 118892]EZF15194.1 hypothetical protein H100_05961 [Trichophyton rubrum MR850]EZF39988.1 hypothetical protein H102_05930 [Trichophyton rubrum CBS 100081]EZF50623.1 hypothetical protein H103_05956 [Trichophyton rubrum CBS 288.86]EZF61076.1 hypothetical protein H104_05943 [Trichophyton rubrum CBS 289.86]EZF71848.1 hypothetical protein H105_05970 [Trichophyton soudanense CBS 452.61]EZF82546.1 hypothetical protein H110_05952 [Trichophy
MAPQFLDGKAGFPLSESDRQILAQTDDEFICHDWQQLKDIIASNQLELLKRKPSDLRRYAAWSSTIKERYGNIGNFICKERLHWPIDRDPQTLCQNPTPFADPRDYKILRNDWPYGLAPDITHMCVWIKNRIDTTPENGDVTEESRALIDDFVHRTFTSRLSGFSDAADRVIWFKNWTALQSVGSLEHIHVLVRDIPDKVIVEWTGEEARELSLPNGTPL